MIPGKQDANNFIFSPQKDICNNSLFGDSVPKTIAAKYNAYQALTNNSANQDSRATEKIPSKSYARNSNPSGVNLPRVLPSRSP